MAVSEKDSKKLSFIKWFVGVVLAVITLIVTTVDFEDEPPSFLVENPLVRHDGSLTVTAANKYARERRALMVEFDGLLYPEAVEAPATKELAWQLNLPDLKLPPEALEDGPHELRFGFSPTALSDVVKVLIQSKSPAVEGTISGDTAGERKVTGKAASQSQLQDELIAVDMYLFHRGEYQQIAVPVKQHLDTETGLVYFTFGLDIAPPDITPEDARFEKPFFAIRVTDQAKNDVYLQYSYAQFIAPGEMHFGANLSGLQGRKTFSDLNKSIEASFSWVPEQPLRIIDQLPDGRPPIDLSVTLHKKDIRHLEWVDNTGASSPVSIVFRNDEQIAVSLTDSLFDQDVSTEEDASYHIEKRADGVIYRSNTATPKVVVDGHAVAPTPGKYYRANPGDTLSSISLAAYGESNRRWELGIVRATNKICQEFAGVSCFETRRRLLLVPIGKSVYIPERSMVPEEIRQLITIEVAVHEKEWVGLGPTGREVDEAFAVESFLVELKERFPESAVSYFTHPPSAVPPSLRRESWIRYYGSNEARAIALEIDAMGKESGIRFSVSAGVSSSSSGFHVDVEVVE